MTEHAARHQQDRGVCRWIPAGDRPEAGLREILPACIRFIIQPDTQDPLHLLSCQGMIPFHVELRPLVQQSLLQWRGGHMLSDHAISDQADGVARSGL